MRTLAGPFNFLLRTTWYLCLPSSASPAYPKSLSSNTPSSSSGSNQRTHVESGSCPSKNFLFMRLKCFLSVGSDFTAFSQAHSTSPVHSSMVFTTNKKPNLNSQAELGYFLDLLPRLLTDRLGVGSVATLSGQRTDKRT